jgi:GT2 family glycosyltransferase
VSDVTLIIVNWNAGDMLARCLRHVMAQTLVPDQVVVIDNASTDQSLQQLPAWDRLTVMRMPSNLGFAAGNNHAIAQCRTAYVALLNPDAFPAPDWLQRLMAAAQAYPQAAAFGSRQVCWEDPSRLDGIGDCYHWSGLAWREAHGRVQTTAHLVAREIFAPCAAAALYRRNALAEVGGFDEHYFCYMEDVDLGFRLRLAGHTARYVPEAVVDHVGGATSGGKRSDFSVFHGHRNLVWTYVKNMPAALLWLGLPLHLAANLAALVVFSARGQARVIARAKWQAIRGLAQVWRQRGEVQRQRKASLRAIWRALDKRLWPRPLD